MTRGATTWIVLLLAGCATTASKRAIPPVVENGSGIPVAMSPSALLLPGGVRKLTTALADRQLLPRSDVGDELDDAVEHALAQFQERAKLPVTGLPSYQTASALGLSPEQIFRPSPKAAAGR